MTGSVVESLMAVAPALNLALAGMAVVFGETFIGKGLDRRWLVSLALLGSVLGLLFTFLLWEPASTASYSVFQGLATVDTFALFLGGVILLCTILTLISSVDYLRRFGLDRGEFYALVLFSATGLWVMVATTHLFIIFLGLEVASIALYVLAGYFRKRDRSLESSLKYLLTGAFASSILLYGFAMVYLATGTVDLNGVAAAVESGEASTSVMLLALALILVGLGFKVAVVPFHMWAPDVYEGAPSTVTGFMATAVKAAGFGVLIRVLTVGFGSYLPDAGTMLFWVAIATILAANLVAVAQSNVKRMMAYSSVAHAGYAFMALFVLTQNTPGASGEAVRGLLFYLPAYAVSTLGVFTIISFLEDRRGRGLELEDYAGLYRRYPGLSMGMAVFILSLGGIPPTAGFLAKFHVFGAVISCGVESGSSQPLALAVVGILGSLIGLYYYLRVLIFMYMHEPQEDDRQFRLPALGVSFVVLVTAVLTLWLGLGPAVGFGAADILGWAEAARP